MLIARLQLITLHFWDHYLNIIMFLPHEGLIDMCISFLLFIMKTTTEFDTYWLILKWPSDELMLKEKTLWCIMARLIIRLLVSDVVQWCSFNEIFYLLIFFKISFFNFLLNLIRVFVFCFFTQRRAILVDLWVELIYAPIPTPRTVT